MNALSNERPTNLKRWERDKSRGASLHYWKAAGTRKEGKLDLVAYRLRFDPKTGKKSVLIWAPPGWRKAYEIAENILAGRTKDDPAPVAKGEADHGLAMQQVFEQCMAVKTSDSSATRLRTVESYRKEWATTIEPVFGSRGIKTVTGEDISKWMASKLFNLSHRRTARGVAPAKASSRTRAKRLALLQLVFKWAFKRHLVARLPFDDSHVVHVLKLGSQGKGKLVGDARVGAVVTLEEVEQVVAWLEERRTDDETDPVFQDPVPSMAIRVAAYAGLRLRELVHARVEDVSPDGRFIQVVSGRPCACAHCKGDGGKFHTKNASNRTVTIAPELAPVLAEYLVERREVPADANGIRFLFPVWRSRLRTRAEAGAQRRSESIAKTWKRAAKEAVKRTDVILHDLRRTSYTDMCVRSGYAMIAVKSVIGHRLDTLEATYHEMDRELLYDQIYPPASKKPVAASTASVKHKFQKSRAVA